MDDPQSSDNDRFIAKQLLLNANIAANMALPSCQNTGTAIVMGKKDHRVWTDGKDEESIFEGVFQTYRARNLRYSQLAPITTYKEANTKCNLPAQVDLLLKKGDSYDFLFKSPQHNTMRVSPKHLKDMPLVHLALRQHLGWILM